MSGVAAGQGLPDGRGEVVLAQVYAAHADRVVGWFVRRTRDLSLAEDLAQDTFERFARALDGVDGSRPTWPYLQVVATNVLIDYMRRAERQQIVPVEEVGAALPHVPVVDEQVVLGDLLGRGLEGLSVRQRVAVELQYERGWSVEEAAAFLGVTTLSFRQLSWRARQRLKVWLEQVDDTLRGVVPVGVGVRARWRSWTAKCRELLSGPAPAVSIDAATSILIAALSFASVALVRGANMDVGPSVSLAGHSAEAVVQDERPVTLRRERTTDPNAPLTSESSHPTVTSSASRGGDDRDMTVLEVPDNPATEGRVEAGEEDRRFRVTHEIAGHTGIPIDGGGGLSIPCETLVGDICHVEVDSGL